MSRTSSIACPMGTNLGIKIKPGDSLLAINSPKCRGIVRTSCVTRIRPNDPATARTSGSFIRSEIMPCGNSKINFRLTPENTGYDMLIKVGVGQETNSQPYLGRDCSRARFSFPDRLSGRGDCLTANSSDKRCCSQRYAPTAPLFAR